MSPTRRASATVSNLRNAVAAGGPQAAPVPVDIPTETASLDIQPTPPPAEPEPLRKPGPPPRPPKPIRFTLDLDKDRHSFLKRFAVDAELDSAVVMRVLLDQLRADDQLAQRVREIAWAVQ